jgi:hypothetical protein
VGKLLGTRGRVGISWGELRKRKLFDKLGLRLKIFLFDVIAHIRGSLLIENPGEIWNCSRRS